MKNVHKPNVLLIHADQHRKDCLGAYGNQQIKTPNLDALAADGVLHTNHYCSYPVCTPSRYSLLSGQYVHQHLGWNNHCTLPSGIPTFPKMLRETGYKTAAVGKMHFAPTYLDVGFDKMILAEQDGPGRFEDDYHEYLRLQGFLDCNDLYDQRSEYRQHADPTYWQSFGAQESNLPLEHHSTSYITGQAVNEISQWQEDAGNLLMVGYIKPHHPFDPPAPYSKLYDPDQLDLLPGYTDEIHEPFYKNSGYFDHSKLSPDALRFAMAMYYATITHIDDCVGQLVKQLKDQGQYDNTLIIYTSDHGDYLGYHHLLLKSHRMFEPLMNIPLIIKPVDRQKKMVCDDLSSNVDVAGYILKTCGLEKASNMSRYELMSEQSKRSSVLAECLQKGDRISYMLRTQRYKLILEGDKTQAVLYDLVEDPCEMVDIAEQEGSEEIIEDLRQSLCQEVMFESPSKVHLDSRAPLSNCVDPEGIEKRKVEMIRWHQSITGIKPKV